MNIKYVSDDNLKIIAENIKKYRKLRNLSLEVLANKIGVTKKTIHRYENAERKLDEPKLLQLAEALNVPFSSLTEGISEHIITGIINLPVVELNFNKTGDINEKIKYYEATPIKWIGNGEFFYLDCSISDNVHTHAVKELFLIQKQDKFDEGDLIIIMQKNTLFLRKVFKHQKYYILQSLLPNIPPVLYEPNEKDIHLIGKLYKTINSY